jgi:CheY-like chemotaxis protein
MDEKDREFLKISQLAVTAGLSNGVLHTINNLLQAISGQAQLELLRNPALPHAQTLQRIADWAHEAGRQSRAVLALSRPGTEQGPGDIAAAVQRTEVLFDSRTLDLQGVVIQWDEVRGLPHVEATTECLQVVLANLVKNAIESFEGRSGAIHVSARHTGDEVLVSVWNSGPGVPQHLMRRLFQPWMTSKADRDGHGIGLFLSRELLRSVGCDLRVQNVDSGGVEFIVELKISSRTPATELSSMSDPTRNLNGKNVLLVEDDQSVREVMKLVIPEATGAILDVAESGSRALDMCQAAEYDAILMDLRMPGMSGQEVYMALPEEARRRVVFVTGDVVSPGIREFLETTGQPVLMKPVAMDQVQEAIASVLSD